MSQNPILLDTNALIFIALGERIQPEAMDALAEALSEGDLRVSPISAWEIGLLVARGRLALPSTPLAWFRSATGRRGMKVDELSPEVLIASSFLPGSPPADPADRIVAATARELGYRLMTRDAKLLAYAEAGHLAALAC